MITTEERIKNTIGKLELLGLSSYEVRKEVIVYRDAKGLHAINCTKSNGSIAKAYDNIEVYEDFIVCRDDMIDSISVYDIYTKYAELPIFNTTASSLIKEHIKIIGLDNEIAVISTSTKIGNTKMKLLAVNGNTLNIRWTGSTKLMMLHTVKNRLDTEKILTFHDGKDTLLRINSNLDILYKLDTRHLELTDKKTLLTNITNKLQMLDIEIQGRNTWAIAYEESQGKYRVVNCSISNGSIDKLYDEVAFYRNYIICDRYDKKLKWVKDIYCKDTKECIKTLRIESGKRIDIHMEGCKDQESLIVIIEQGKELSVNWYEYKITIINTYGKWLEIGINVSSIRLKRRGKICNIACEDYKLFAVDENLNILDIDAGIKFSQTRG